MSSRKYHSETLRRRHHAASSRANGLAEQGWVGRLASNRHYSDIPHEINPPPLWYPSALAWAGPEALFKHQAAEVTRGSS